MPRVYIGIGSNLGARTRNIATALELLPERGFEIRKRSRTYETEPRNMKNCRKFLNLVIAADTQLPPAACLANLLEVERALGRKRHRRNAPRVIDLDLLLYGKRVVRSPGLSIPHPRMHERAFVLEPLCDIAPGLVHPVLHRRMLTLLEGLDRKGVCLWKPA